MFEELKPSERIKQITTELWEQALVKLPEDAKRWFKESAPNSTLLELNCKVGAIIQYLDEDDQKATDFMQKFVEGSGVGSEGRAQAPEGSPPPSQPPQSFDAPAEPRTEPEEPSRPQS